MLPSETTLISSSNEGKENGLFFKRGGVKQHNKIIEHVMVQFNALVAIELEKESEVIDGEKQKEE